jgi:AraC family transcriptional regulator
MILRYVNSGSRSLGEKPYEPFARLSWEFYMVTHGFCGMILEGGERLPLQKSHLWMLPPHFIHGWYGIVGKPCRVLVFHFSSIPRQLEDLVPRNGYFEMPLTAAERERLIKMELPLEKDFYRQNPLSDLRFHKAMMDISLFILERKSARAEDEPQQKSRVKVDEALTWFRQHLRDHPSLEELARAVHVSPSHLRRLFAEVLHKSPSDVMHEIKLQAAMHALSETDAKIDAIALDSGFSSASVFCRSFKASKNCTPVEWRRRMPV